MFHGRANPAGALLFPQRQLADLKRRDCHGDGCVEAVGPPGHRDFGEQVAFSLIFYWEPLLLIADQEEARLLVFGFDIILFGLEAGPDQLSAPLRNQVMKSTHRAAATLGGRPSMRPFDREGVGAIIDQDQSASSGRVASAVVQIFPDRRAPGRRAKGTTQAVCVRDRLRLPESGQEHLWIILPDIFDRISGVVSSFAATMLGRGDDFGCQRMLRACGKAMISGNIRYLWPQR
jgi:hypothetical protein